MPYLGHKGEYFYFFVGLVVLGVVTTITYRKDRAGVITGVIATAIGAVALLAPPLYRMTRKTIGRTGGTPRVEMVAENAPGRAQIRLVNLGERAVFTANARVSAVSERVVNKTFLQTYPLRWASNGKAELSLGTGAAGVLPIATLGQTQPSAWGGPVPPSRDIHELLLEGIADDKPTRTDWFRWHDGDASGAVTVNLDVTVSSSAAEQPLTGRFVIISLEFGGVQIQEAPGVST